MPSVKQQQRAATAFYLKLKELSPVGSDEVCAGDVATARLDRK